MSRSHGLLALGAIVFSSSLPLMTASAQGRTESKSLNVTDSRPVEAAILSLITNYPTIVTYEDPRYEFSGDIRDVTDVVRKERGENRSGVLVPRGGPLNANYVVYESASAADNVAGALNSIVGTKNLDAVGGRFAIERRGDAFHVVPTAVRDRNGAWVQQTSILDTPITIGSGPVDGNALIEAILQKVREAGGANILGMSAEGFASTFRRYTGSIEAQNEPARDVLLRALHSISKRFTWLLNYDPSGQYYVFVVAAAAEPPRKETPLDLSVLPRGGAPTPAGPPFKFPPPGAVPTSRSPPPQQ
jgi:hypothetical protein